MHRCVSYTRRGHVFPKSSKAIDFPLSGTFIFDEILMLLGIASQFEPLADAPNENANASTFLPPILDGSDLSLQPHTQAFLQLLSFQATSTLN